MSVSECPRWCQRGGRHLSHRATITTGAVIVGLRQSGAGTPEVTIAAGGIAAALTVTEARILTSAVGRALNLARRPPGRVSRPTARDRARAESGGRS